MVLREKSEYSSLSRYSTPSAPTVWVWQWKTNKGEGSGRVPLLLRSPLGLGDAELPPELINQCHIWRSETSALLEFKSNDDTLWRFRTNPRDSDRVKSFLKTHNVNISQLTAKPIVEPSKSRIVPAHTSAMRSSGLKSHAPMVRSIVDRMFPEGNEQPFKRSMMISGENGREKRGRTSPEKATTVGTSAKQNSPQKTGLETKIASPAGRELVQPGSKPAQPNVPAPSRNETIDTLDGLLEPTPEFLDELAKTHNSIKFVHSDGRSTCLSLATVGRFQNNVYLDDTLICFFLKRYHEQMQDANSTHIFDTQLYPRIETSTLSWTRKVDFTSKRLVVIPIHHMDHWSAAVVYGVDAYISTGDPPPKIIYFDSLSVTLSSSRKYFRKCAQFLNQVFEARNIKLPKYGRYPKITAKVPIQGNGSDCGIYMLEFMRIVMENADEFCKIVSTGSKFALSDIHSGEMRTRADYLETLKQYSAQYPDNAPVEEYESDLEIEVR